MTDVATILLVDNHPVNLQVLSAVLANLQVNLLEAQSGPEAIELAKQHELAAILLDVVMPDMDGFETATHLRSIEIHKLTPIIFITALQKTQEDIRRAYELGAIDYLIKPFEPEIVRAKVENFLQLDRYANDLRNAKMELKRSNDALTEFAAAVSHDLQAPIRQMKTFSQVLAEDYQDVLEPSGFETLQRIERGADRACDMVSAMLEYATVGKKGECREDVDLGIAVNDALSNLNEVVKAANAEINVGDMPRIYGIQPQLVQLFQNLISNAIKFKHSERPISISITSHCQDDDNWQIRVEDNGIGIADEYQARVFKMLERLHSKDVYEGCGIGLAICKRIVENHHGRIWVESEQDKGTRFLFTLGNDDALRT